MNKKKTRRSVGMNKRIEEIREGLQMEYRRG